jgi:hypothetical protein
MKHIIYCSTLFLIMASTIITFNLRTKWKSDSTLDMNEQLDSQNKNYFAIMQSDGNFVVYSSGLTNGKGSNNPIWNSKTFGQGKSPYRAIMQTDGNLVVYDSNNTPLWNAQTYGKGTGPYRLIMQNDGNLVLYDNLNSALWASNTMGQV